MPLPLPQLLPVPEPAPVPLLAPRASAGLQRRLASIVGQLAVT